MDVLALHARITRDFDRRDLESYLEAMHPEVEFTTVAFGEERVFRGHAGVREWWETLDGAGRAMTRTRPRQRQIADDAIVIRARIRAPNQSGGYLDAAGALAACRSATGWSGATARGVRGRGSRRARPGWRPGLDERNRVRLAAPWPVRGLHGSPAPD